MQALEKFTQSLSRYFEWAGVVGMLIMFAVNLIDVIGAKLFQWPLPGALEMLGFALLVAIAPAIAQGLFLGTHISVDFIVEKFPGTLRRVLSIFVYLICMILFVLIFWQASEYGYSLQQAGEIGSSSKIPLFPFAYILSISCIPVVLYFLLQTMKCFKAGK